LGFGSWVCLDFSFVFAKVGLVSFFIARRMRVGFCQVTGIGTGIYFVAKPSHPLFDTREEALSSFPTWIKLPNLHIEFWSDSGLKAINDVLGKFIASYTSYKSNNFRSVAQILVE
jgi:hypothetical protein